jgi:hypothetical protein
LGASRLSGERIRWCLARLVAWRGNPSAIRYSLKRYGGSEAFRRQRGLSTFDFRSHEYGSAGRMDRWWVAESQHGRLLDMATTSSDLES